MTHPVPGQEYSLLEIKSLLLRDIPSLEFWGPNNRKCVVQTAHVTEDVLLANPEWASTRWTYRYETHEWVPVFLYAGSLPLLVSLLSFEVALSPYGDDTDDYWCVPKIAPRTQYYELTKDGNGIWCPPAGLIPGSTVYPLPSYYAHAQKHLAVFLEKNKQ